MPNTFAEVGTEAGLVGQQLSRYTTYMLVRWAHKERELCSSHYTEYAKGWALRFLEGTEYQNSDREGIAVLNAIDKEGSYDQIKACVAKEQAKDQSDWP